MTPYDLRRRLVGLKIHATDGYGDPDDPDWERPRIVAIARDRTQRKPRQKASRRP